MEKKFVYTNDICDIRAMAKKLISMRFNEKLLKKGQVMAKKRRRSFTALLEDLLDREIQAEEQQKKEKKDQ